MHYERFMKAEYYENFMRQCACACKRMRVYARARVCVRVYARACMRARVCVRAYAHTHTRQHINEN